MNILLTKPPDTGTPKGTGLPLGLAYVAGALKTAGHTVSVLDMTVDDTPLHDALKGMDMVGISCLTSERFDAFTIAREAKIENENIKVVLGGAHITFTSRETMMGVPDIDACVLYEGEETMTELASAWESGKEPSDVRGITYRKGYASGDAIITTPSRPLIENLDVLRPARELFHMEEYTLHLSTPERERVTNIVANRGCPYGCKFCSATLLNGLRIRSRSADNVLEEIVTLRETYKFLEGFYIYDDHFTLNKQLALKICKGMEGMDISWGCFSRADAISKDLVEAMARAGCRTISFGVESGSPKILTAMGKRTTPDIVQRAARTVKDAGIIPRATIIFGYPGETLYDVYLTYRLLKKAGYTRKDLGRGYHLLYFPGTEVTEQYFPGFDWVHGKHPNWKGIPQRITRFDKTRVLATRAMGKLLL